MDRIQATWYGAVAWIVIAPVWAIGAFVLAAGFLAVPSVLLDGHHLRIGMPWGRFLPATSWLPPFRGSRAPPPAKAAKALESIDQGQL